MTMAEILTGTGVSILVDDEDFSSLPKTGWYIQDGYARRSQRVGPRSEGKQLLISMHRQIMGLQPGDKRQVDHINRNRLDNRRCNLRICTKDENSRNRTMHSNNLLGVKGVSAHGNKFRSEIQINKRRIYLGLHPTVELAKEFYDLAAQMIHGEFASEGA